MWGLVSECRVKTFGIVAQFYVPRNIVDGVPAGRVLRAVNPLGFEGGEERFGHRVVVAAARPPDGLPDAAITQRLGELRRRVVAAPVRVEYSSGPQVVITCRHLDRRLD